MKYWLLIKKRPHLFTTVWALFILVLCATPGQYIPSANWLELLSFDKFVHAFIFFVLSVGLLLIAKQQSASLFKTTLLVFIAVAYGVAIEWMQAHWFSNRSADVLDSVANSTGCAVAWLLRKKVGWDS